MTESDWAAAADDNGGRWQTPWAGTRFLSVSLLLTNTHLHTVQFAYVSKAHSQGSREPCCNFLEGSFSRIQQPFTHVDFPETVCCYNFIFLTCHSVLHNIFHTSLKQFSLPCYFSVLYIGITTLSKALSRGFMCVWKGTWGSYTPVSLQAETIFFLLL